MRNSMLGLAVAVALGSSAGCAREERISAEEVSERFCRRVVTLQQGRDLTSDQLRSVAGGLSEDAEAFRRIGDDATARRVEGLADHLVARARDPAIPTRAVDARLLSLCLSGAED